ncbi:Calponin homology domain-containing protein [Dioscorea alata]|uniref:Calponin homology domain-containing protein n=1 Tax=Dioscorea alata TaxID=55571 RepID=A0ACB7TZ97_DIOAL|nr:Calponin homology domain-containing protein [Dioscorea alata]
MYSICAAVIIPEVTNCNQSWKNGVILHSSIDKLSKELLDQILDKQITFDMMVCGRASVRSSKYDPATILESVKRLSNHSRLDSNSQLKSENMLCSWICAGKDNLSKAYPLLSFWGYLTMLDNFDSRKYAYDLNGSVNTCQLFALDAAVKAMPLKMFLEVVGSAEQFDDLVMNCKLGMRFSDLSS